MWQKTDEHIISQTKSGLTFKELEEGWGEGKLQGEFTQQVAGRTGCERRPAYSQVTVNKARVTVPQASNLVCMHFKVLLYKIMLIGDSCIKGAGDLMV